MISKLLRLNNNFKKSTNLLRTYSRLTQPTIDSICSIFGKQNVNLTESVRQHYSKDESLHAYVVYILFK
jgi:hypothetical protein